MSEWVSVEDRFPGMEQRVIIRYMRTVFGVPHPHYEMGYFVNPDCVRADKLVGWLFWRDNKRVEWPVTHWSIPPEVTP